MPWQAGLYKKFVDSYEQALRPIDWPNYVLGNHDQSRVAARLGQPRARLSAMLEFTLRGTPFVYYGEELGMEDAQLPWEAVLDPFEKNVPGARLGRDPERTPMQWNGQANAGFSSATPWLPVHENYQKINAEAEMAEPESMWHLYRRLIALRAGSAALLQGAYRSFDLGDGEVFAFERAAEQEIICVVLNFSDQEKTVDLPFFAATTLSHPRRGRGSHRTQR